MLLKKQRNVKRKIRSKGILDEFIGKTDGIRSNMKANTKAKEKFLKGYDKDIKKELAKLAKKDKRLQKEFKHSAVIARRELKKKLNRM